jgi:hypothetical protein
MYIGSSLETKSGRRARVEACFTSFGGNNSPHVSSFPQIAFPKAYIVLIDTQACSAREVTDSGTCPPARDIAIDERLGIETSIDTKADPLTAAAPLP